jgi:hypothetical protein
MKSAGTYSSIGIAASSFSACFMIVRFGNIRVSFIAIPLVALIAERPKHERILPFTLVVRMISNINGSVTYNLSLFFHQKLNGPAVFTKQ